MPPRFRGISRASLGEDLFVGLGVVAAVSAALVIARRRHRRRYRPGSGDRADLPVAPAVYQLRLAYLRAAQQDEDGLDGGLDRAEQRPRPTPPLEARGDGARDEQGAVLSLGARDGREIALDLAAAQGLGLVGAGAPAAARALLVTALTATSETVHGTGQVVVATDDLAAVLGRRTADTPLPASVRVVANLDAALDVLEAETLVRAGQQRHAPGAAWPPVLLVAQTPERQRHRLQSVLDNGSAVGITGLLLGQWTSGVTAFIRDDGTISTTNPGLGEPLRGTRVFRLGENHTAELLAVLHDADPDDADPDDADPADEQRRELESPQDDEVAETTNEITAGITAPGAAEAAAGSTNPEFAVQSESRSRANTNLEILDATPAQGHAPRHRPQASQPASVPVVADVAAAAGACGGEPATASAPLRISVLGPPRTWWRPAPKTPAAEGIEREITSAFQPRLRELICFLALHPDGASREALIGALWPASPAEKTTNALNTSLSRLRRAVTAATEGAVSDIVLAGQGRYRLDPALVEVDYHQLAAAVAARRAATTERDRVDAYRRIVDSYTGPLADGLSTEWIETAREAIRRDAIDAVAALARALVDHDPQQTLDLLEIARAFDPHNEALYRDIMRLQERLGQLDAIPRTLTLLTTRLAELDDQPTPHAVNLAERLGRRHDSSDDSGDPPLGIDRRPHRAG